MLKSETVSSYESIIKPVCLFWIRAESLIFRTPSPLTSPRILLGSGVDGSVAVVGVVTVGSVLDGVVTVGAVGY